MLFAMLLTLQDPMRELDQLRRQIEMLQGLDAIELSREQMEKIVALAERAAKERKDALERSAEAIAEMKKALESYRDALAAGTADAESRRKIDELQRDSGETMRELFEANGRLSAELEELLTKEQWEAARKVGRPDPSRHLREMFGQMLDRFREEEEFPESLADFVYDRLDEMSEHLGLDPKEVPDESGRIAEEMNRALDLPAEEYEKKRDEILRGLVEGGALGEALKKREPQAPQGPDPRMAEIFTDPVVVAALKKRIGG